MSFLDIDGRAIWYETDGDPSAPTLLLLNSLGTDVSLWDAQVEVLARHHRVVRYDLPGHGRSQAGRDVLLLSDLGRDAVAVLDAVGTSEAVLCGISLGGLIGLWLTGEVPQRVRGLVVANSAARLGTAQAWEDRMAATDHGMAHVAGLVAERFFSPDFRARHPARAEEVLAMVAATDPAGYRGCCAALRDADLSARLPTPAPPVLVIGSDEDTATPWPQARELASAIDGARLHRLSGGHLSNVEQPAAFAAVVAEFLAHLPTPHPRRT